MEEIRVKTSTESLSILVRDKILELIEKKELVANAKLPPEEEFAKKLGVSRGILREAYRLLEEDGFINRRPGVGTFVMNRPQVVRNPLEVNFSVTEIIESMGATPGALDIKVKYEKADSYISKKLEVQLETPIIIVERTRTANG
jgi:GntR family transcriptional regulator